MMIHLNGILVTEEEARIDPADRGVTMGDGLYETILVQEGKPKRLSSHLARLRNGAEVLGIPLTASGEDLLRHIHETLETNSIKNGALRLTLTRGPAPRGLAPPAHPHPTLLITAREEDSKEGTPLNVIIAKETRRNEYSPLSRCKTISCLDNILARREAERCHAQEAILLNTAGRVAETTVANLFVVMEGTLLTPPLSEGALPGVMRAEIMKGTHVMERPLAPENLRSASEVLATNCLGIRPIVTVDGTPIGTGRPGPVFERLIK